MDVLLVCIFFLNNHVTKHKTVLINFYLFSIKEVYKK